MDFNLNKSHSRPIKKQRPSELILGDPRSGAPIIYPQSPYESIRRQSYMNRSESTEDYSLNDSTIAEHNDEANGLILRRSISSSINRSNISFDDNDLPSNLSRLSYDEDFKHEHLRRSVSSPANNSQFSSRKRIRQSRNTTAQELLLNEETQFHQQTNASQVKKSVTSFAYFVQRIFILICCLLAILVLIIYPWTIYYFYRSCSGIHQHNTTGLAAILSDNLFGQRLASEMIPTRLAGYLNTASSEPLVLFFNGSSGVGKTFTARLLADFLTAEGANVNWYLGGIGSVKDWALQRMSICALNLFIFEDIDLAPERTAAEFRELVCKWNSNVTLEHGKSVFVVISNEGARQINDLILKQRRRMPSWSRDDISIRDIMISLDTSAMALCSSTEMALETVIVPFLPLEKSQVIQCLKRIVSTRNLKLSPEEIYDYATQAVDYFPDELPVFSKWGCKQLKLDKGIVPNPHAAWLKI